MKKDSKLKMMIGFTHRLKRFFLFSILTAIVATFLSFLAPLIVGFTVDSVIGDQGTVLPAPVMWIFEQLNTRGTLFSALLVCAVMIAVTELISGLFNYFSRVSMAKGSERMINNLRINLYSHTQNLPFEWHTNNQTGDIIQRCTSDVETVRRFVFNQLIEVIRTAILVIIAIIIMFSLNVVMATVVTLFIPFIMAYTFFFFRQIAKKFLLADKAEGALMVRVQENLTGVRVVRAFGREIYETEQFDEKNEDFANKWIKLGGTLGVYWGIGDGVSFLQMFSVIIVGAYLAMTSTFTVGELLVFLGYTNMLMWPVRQLGRIINEMSRAGVSLGRIKEILDVPEESDSPDSITPPIDRDIVFENVSFSYEEQPVLENVSFKVKNGTTFGILGATGSGKSTITYLLNRLYDLPENGGKIMIGGVDISQIKKRYLRRNIGLVLQEPFLFSKTILENIDIASRKSDLAKVREKARIAAVDDNIEGFSKGYDTIVGERGVTLSGGQKQRVAIARTLMMDAPIMVFDDSMSNLDMETDAQIRESLREDTEGSTVILISHRISTLMKADVIMVLDEGRVEEIGSHAELVQKDGIYRRIYDLQSGYVSSDARCSSNTERGEAL
ncbi:MAG: ABC transporter ATP-binding protein/permease [Oscillospiraceae bacterium]|nr:ABC transporter ATP-binding protein/permease [Oscillospiraceae bacterium]